VLVGARSPARPPSCARAVAWSLGALSHGEEFPNAQGRSDGPALRRLEDRQLVDGYCRCLTCPNLVPVCCRAAATFSSLALMFSSVSHRLIPMASPLSRSRRSSCPLILDSPAARGGRLAPTARLHRPARASRALYMTCIHGDLPVTPGLTPHSAVAPYVGVKPREA
jgi:hypothetical protein